MRYVNVPSRASVVIAVFLAALLICLVTPSAGESQQRLSVDGRAGVALPTGRLSDVTDPGPNVGVQLGYPLGDRLAINVKGDLDLLKGAKLSSGKAPDLTLWSYGAGLEAAVLRPESSRWSLTADLGVGATTFESDAFVAPGSDESQDLSNTYFASNAGLRLGYQMSDRVSTHVGATAQWTSAKASDTEALRSLDPVNVRRLSSAWSVPVTIGVRIRTGRNRSTEQTAAAPPPATRSAPAPRAADDSRERARAAALATLQEQIHFDFDRFEIRAQDALVLDRKIEILREYPELRLVVEGHCDEWGSVEYNQALGLRRAAAVRDYLTSHGVAASRLQTTSYGKERPLVLASNEGAWAQNRRAEFVVGNPEAIALLGR